MLTRLLKDSAIYGTSNLLSRGIQFLLLPVYTRWLSPTDYGIIDTLTIFRTLVTLTVALEITQGFARHFADSQSPSRKIGYASTSLWFTVTVYALFAGIGLAFSGPLALLLLETTGYSALMSVATIVIAATGLFQLSLVQLRWKLQPKLHAIVSLTYTLVTACASILFVVVFALGVMGVIYGQLVGALIGTTLGLYFARENIRFKFDRGQLREMLSFSIPLVPSSIGVFVSQYIDRIAIKQLMTLADLGIFGVAHRIASVVTLILVGFQGALTPLIFETYRSPETPRELARIFRVFVVFALITFVGLSLFARESLLLLTTPDFYSAAAVIPLLVPAALLTGMYIFAPGISLAKRTGIIATINVAGAIINIALNFALIPILGIRGSALATLISSAVVFGMYIYFSQKFYPVPHAWQPLVIATLVSAGAVWIGTLINVSLVVNTVIKVILICASAGSFFVLGLVNSSEIKRARARIARLLLSVKG